MAGQKDYANMLGIYAHRLKRYLDERDNAYTQEEKMKWDTAIKTTTNCIDVVVKILLMKQS